MITFCNLISGCIAVVYALGRNYTMALAFIILGAIFDFFDGMSARLLGVSSPIGKELDSLADDVTFGVAPSAMIFSLLCTADYPGALSSYGGSIAYVAFLMAAFSALRLAKFNLDARQTSSFIGLPTPANALFWGALIVGGQDTLERLPYMPIIVIVMVLISCYLLVSEIPMFALKFKTWGWSGNEIKYVFVISCVPLLLVFGIVGFSILTAWSLLLSFFPPYVKNSSSKKL